MVNEKYSPIKIKDALNDTAKKYIIPGHVGTFAIISTMTHPFCGDCNRLRLTADGKMKNCLFSKTETDLLSALRNGEDITSLILANIQNKAAALGGQFDVTLKEKQAEMIDNRSMISIGG